MFSNIQIIESDFLNSLNNSISGLIYVSLHDLQPGPACTFNGWIGQLSVQATDFSILAISIATLLVVTRKTLLDNLPKLTKVLLCLTIWIMPLISSTTITALGEMKPVSGNWCWISKDRSDLRYGLAHGWRALIILSTICIYLYIYQYLGRHFRSLIVPSIFSQRTQQRHEDGHRQCRSMPSQHGPVCPQPQPQTPLNNYGMTHGFLIGGQNSRQACSNITRLEGYNLRIWQNHLSRSPIVQDDLWTRSTSSTVTTEHGKVVRARQRTEASVEAAIKRMLLLNGYPIMYIILWIPGLTNRVLEASGKPSSSKVLAALQCSTQFVGFANAITYGLNRELRQVLRSDLRRLLHGNSRERIETGD